MNNLLMLILVPLVVGFIMLFIPGKLKILHKLIAFLISLGAFGLSVLIFFRDQPLSYSLPLFSQDTLNLTFLLQTTVLNKFLLFFAMGFGFLICLYTLQNPPSDTNASFFSVDKLLTVQPFSATTVLRMMKTAAEQVVPAMAATN